MEIASKVITAVAVFTLVVLLLCVLPAQPTGADPDVDFVCKIRASGGDYTGVKAWDAAIACDLTASSTKVFTVSDRGTYVTDDDGDSVTFSGGGTGTLKHISTFDKALIVDCSGTIDAGTVTCDSSGNTFEISDTGDQIGDAVASLYNDWPDGLDEYYIDFKTDWTTSASHHIKLWTDPSLSGTEGPNRHNGTAESGFYFKSNSGSYGLVMRVSNVIVDGIEAQAPNCTAGWFYNTNNSFTNVLKNSIMHNLKGLRWNTGASTIENCIIYDFGSTGYSVVNFGTVRNCSIYADSGVGSYSGQIIVRNAECYNVLCWNADSGVGYDDYYYCTGDYNISSDDSAPGSNSLHDQTLTDIKWESTTSGSEDLHLQPGSCAIDAGTDLSAYFTNDIDGDIRTAPWDIGADEGNQPPDIPTLDSPYDGETGVDLTPDLVFNYSDPDGDDCTKFDLKLDDDSDFSSPEIDETDYGGSWSSGDDITYPVSSPLSPGTQYYWKVRVFDGTVWSDWSDGDWDFTTNYPPDPPDDLGPVEYIDGGWGDNDTPTLEFTQNDPDGDEIQYRVQIIHDIDGVVVDYTSELLPHPGATSFTVGQAEGGGTYDVYSATLPEGEYYWQVMSIDGHGAGGDWTEGRVGDVAFRLDSTAEEGGTDEGEYRTNEDVYVTASGFLPDSRVDVYVVEDYAWHDGDDIPPNPEDRVFAYKALTADGDGVIGGVIWDAPLEAGEYDVVFDANRNGDYDAITDLVDHPNHPGFTVASPSPTVGGEVYPIDKTALLMPWIGLAFVLILALGGGALTLIRRRTNK